jgi:hypothetical protein
MANDNVVFGTIAEVRREPDRETIVTMTDGPVVRAATKYTELLEELRERRMLVYLETEADRITRVRLPNIVLVESIRSADSITFINSHVRAFVRDDAILNTIREAARRGETLAVTLADNFEILDARLFGRPLPVALIPAPRGLAKARRKCISRERAQQLFDLVAARTCNPYTAPPPCIPFQFPDNGCWARAHEMARLMIENGASPRKIWIYGNLRTPTRNNPCCVVIWGWHVAPTLCVRVCRWLPFWTQEQVIDPSLFTKPVSKEKWKSVQGDPKATFVSTSADIFSRWGGEQTDRDYRDTNVVLNYYRMELQARSLSIGPPPYVCPPPRPCI